MTDSKPIVGDIGESRARSIVPLHHLVLLAVSPCIPYRIWIVFAMEIRGSDAVEGTHCTHSEVWFGAPRTPRGCCNLLAYRSPLLNVPEAAFPILCRRWQADEDHVLGTRIDIFSRLRGIAILIRPVLVLLIRCGRIGRGCARTALDAREDDAPRFIECVLRPRAADVTIAWLIGALEATFPETNSPVSDVAGTL